MNNKVRKHEVEQWLGGLGNLNLQECIEIITDVANKNYESEQLHKDIKHYKNCMEKDDES